MGKQNRNRTGSVHGDNQSLFVGVKAEPQEEAPCSQKFPSAHNGGNSPKANVVDSHAPTREAYHAPTHEAPKNEIPPANSNAKNYFGQFPYNHPMSHNNAGNPQWLMPNGMVDACPVFTANLYQNWCREVKLWRHAPVGANPAQIIAKIAATIPTNSRMGALAYLENTTHLRSVDQVIDISNHRFGRADSERAWSRMSAFTEFKRGGSENYKDFWARFTRCVTRLSAHGSAMSESVISHLSIQALRAPEGQFPILLAALETFPNPTSVDSLKSPTIKTYETHRGGN